MLAMGVLFAREDLCKEILVSHQKEVSISESIGLFLKVNVEGRTSK